MDEARLAVIIAAIRALKPEDFTQAGPPKMDALKAAVPDVTAAERDAAWKKIQEEDAEKTPAADDEPPVAEEKTVITGEDVLKNLRATGHKI